METKTSTTPVADAVSIWKNGKIVARVEPSRVNPGRWIAWIVESEQTKGGYLSVGSNKLRSASSEKESEMFSNMTSAVMDVEHFLLNQQRKASS